MLDLGRGQLLIIEHMLCVVPGNERKKGMHQQLARPRLKHGC